MTHYLWGAPTAISGVLFVVARRGTLGWAVAAWAWEGRLVG
jgi:hypothetical protein